MAKDLVRLTQSARIMLAREADIAHAFGSLRGFLIAARRNALVLKALQVPEADEILQDLEELSSLSERLASGEVR